VKRKGGQRGGSDCFEKREYAGLQKKYEIRSLRAKECASGAGAKKNNTEEEGKMKDQIKQKEREQRTEEKEADY